MYVHAYARAHIWSLDSVTLWAGSYQQAASGPETGLVDIGGTHIAASVSTVISFTKYHTCTHGRTDTRTHAQTAGDF